MKLLPCDQENETPHMYLTFNLGMRWKWKKDEIIALLQIAKAERNFVALKRENIIIKIHTHVRSRHTVNKEKLNRKVKKEEKGIVCREIKFHNLMHIP